ncbi:MAG: phosphohydrolase, partial [Treponema sp.]|nr:phosphohydrolase [Treponema sp.]
SSAGSHRYDGHAELGEFQARRFLERLGFGQSLTNDVCFLVKNHMLPAALPRLPLFRTEQIMSSPLFPLLMELYRCDESSSFKGLDGYYESSAVYQQFLRNKRNPYRTADGKKLHKKQKSGVRK